MFYKERIQPPGSILTLPRSDSVQSAEYRHLVHELRSHQIELEMQNEELRRTEARLRETSKRYSDLYDFAPTGYFTLSARGVIRDMNLKATTYLGRPRALSIGRPLDDFIVPASLPIFRKHLRDCLQSSTSVSCNIQMSGADGVLFEAEMESIVWIDGMEQAPFIRTIVRDVTQRRAVERELEAARDRAEAASNAKSQFLANMSHEMRTPLGVILGFTDLLMDTIESQEELERGLKTIHRNGFHLLSLIDDLLDLAKIEAGQMNMEILEFSLVEEIQTLVSEFRQKCSEKHLELHFKTLTEVPEKIFTDPIRFRQVFLNILSNAVKFTDAGTIQVELSYVHREPGQGSENLLYIDVTDSGCGISPEQLDLLFRPFSQADASTTRKFGGTGLGLSLARRLAEGLGGGVVLLKSEIEKGSTFRIIIDPHLPDQASESDKNRTPMEASVEEPPSLEGIHVLVVEDGADNRFLITTLLETAGAKVQCAENGQLAVEYASEGSYDVVLMDIQLPILDGYSATSEIRRRGCVTPIIALTAHALVEDRLEAEKTGFDAFLSKPIDWNKLANTIARCHDAKKYMN